MLELKRNGLRRKWINTLLRITSISPNGVYLKRGNHFGTAIRIGNGTRINGKFRAKGIGVMSIGKYCAFGENIRALTANHNLNTINLQVDLNKKLSVPFADTARKNIAIGNNVWIGDNVIILPGVTIGDCAIVGAGAVVTKDIEPFSVNAGNPSRFLKYRHPSEEIRELLKGVSWWDWSEKKMASNRNFFQLDFDTISKDSLRSAIENLKE